MVLDFTQTNNPIEIAVMPASIAKRALKALAEQCSFTSSNFIMQEHQEVLIEHRRNENYEGFIQASADFVQERSLMDNIKLENWDAYTVETVEEKVSC